jgi:hypothetical protein
VQGNLTKIGCFKFLPNVRDVIGCFGVSRECLSTTGRDLIKSGLAVSTLSVLPVRGLAELALPAPETGDHAMAREKLLFDFGWKFTRGNADDTKRDLKFGEARSGMGMGTPL